MRVKANFRRQPLSLAIALAMSGTVQAGSFNVGAAGCGLADAIRAANTDTAVGGCPAGSGPDTLRLIKSTFTKTGADDVTLGPTGYPLISSKITLEGDPDGNGVGVIVQRSSGAGTPAFRIFAVAPGGELTLRRVTVENGSQGASAASGAGLLNHGGRLSLNNSTVRGNSGGSAILTEEGGLTTLVGSTVTGNNATGLEARTYYVSPYAQVSLTRSTVTNNSGSGIYCGYKSGCSINSSTISGNTGDGASGFFYSSFSATNSRITGNNGNGIRNVWERAGGPTLTNTEVSNNGGHGISSGSHAILVNSTVSGNGGVGVRVGFIPYCLSTSFTNTTVTGNGGGGAAADATDCVTLRNTILAGNAGTDCYMSSAPGDPSIAGNLIGDGSCNAAARGALTGDPKLAPLLDNGGLTLTHGLRFGLSPAINAGTNTTCRPTDQRDAKRPQNSTCDIGSFELITTPKPTVAAADAFLNASVQAGTLLGTGVGTMPGYRVSAARQQLRVAGDLVSQGKTTDACAQLARTLTRIDADGASPDSNDYLTGPSAPGMVNQVNAIRTNLACS